MALIQELLGHWLTRGQRAQEAELRTLNLEILKKKLAQETQLGETYPTGFEPIPAEQEPIQLTPQEVPLQEEAYTPPPTTPIVTKPGYKGMSMKDIGALHQIGLSALPPTVAKPRGQVLPTGLLKAVEAPTSRYTEIKDEDGNVIGTQVFEGGKPKAQYDVTGKEVPLGTALAPPISQKPRLAPTPEQSEAEAPPVKEGFINQTNPVHDSKGRRLGFETKQIVDPRITGELKTFEGWLEGQGIKVATIKGTPEYAVKHREWKSIGPTIAAEVGERDLLDAPTANWVAAQMARGEMPPSMLRTYTGIGNKGQANVVRIIKQLRQIAPDYNPALIELAYSGDKTAIGKNAALRGSIEGFEINAIQNAKQADALSQKINVTRTPMLNGLVLTGKTLVGGSEIEAQYLLAVETFVREYAKVVNTVTGGGTTAEEASKKIANVINKAYTPEQMQSVLRQSVLEMEHRKYGFEKNLHNILSGWGNVPDFRRPELPTRESIEAIFATPTPLVGAAGAGITPSVSKETEILRNKYKY